MTQPEHDFSTEDPLGLTPAIVADRVTRLAEDWSRDGDDEHCHGLEDSLRGAVLWAISHGHPEAAALAAAVLKTDEINFQRWCA